MGNLVVIAFILWVLYCLACRFVPPVAGETRQSLYRRRLRWIAEECKWFGIGALIGFVWSILTTKSAPQQSPPQPQPQPYDQFSPQAMEQAKQTRILEQIAEAERRRTY